MRSGFQAPTSSKSRGSNRISGFSAEADESLCNLTSNSNDRRFATFEFEVNSFQPRHNLKIKNPSPTKRKVGEKTVRNLSFCRINNKELHLRHTRQPNNTKLESAAQALARKADLTCTVAEWKIKCDRPRVKFLQYQMSQSCSPAKNHVNLYEKGAPRSGAAGPESIKMVYRNVPN